MSQLTHNYISKLNTLSLRTKIIINMLKEFLPNWKIMLKTNTERLSGVTYKQLHRPHGRLLVLILVLPGSVETQLR